MVWTRSWWTVSISLKRGLGGHTFTLVMPVFCHLLYLIKTLGHSEGKGMFL